ncbi:MAG: amidohydrolase family protein [Planctomycetota bacterium]|jgi:predicted TIM-barrel fold metal-dependent hydrolase
MIDCHYHLEEKLVSVSGLLSSIDDAGIERVALMAPIQEPFDLPQTLLEMLPIIREVSWNEDGNVHQNFLDAYAGSINKDGTMMMADSVVKVLSQPDNDKVMKTVVQYPDRFIGWIFVNPAGPVDPIEEIERCLQTGGMIGVKTHPYIHNYPLSQLVHTAAYCVGKDLPLLAHMGAGPGGDFKLLPEKFPKLKIIYAHAGVPYGPWACNYAGEKENVYVDLVSDLVDLNIANQAIQRAGVNKCLFGTDGPYGHNADDRFDFNHTIRMIRDLQLSNDDYERVVKGNFEDIIGA